jgi:prepilin-type N-terminal cleavage/methylation domain-containing protein
MTPLSAPRHPPRQASISRGSGFSLMELLVVMLIISIASGVFLGYNYRQRDSVRLRSAAGEVRQFLRVVQGHAVLEGRDNTCQYRIGEHTLVEALRGRKLALPESVTLDLEGQRLEEEAVVLARFFADGSAEAGRIVLAAAGQNIIVIIDPVLGEVHVEQ